MERLNLMKRVRKDCGWTMGKGETDGSNALELYEDMVLKHTGKEKRV